MKTKKHCVSKLFAISAGRRNFAWQGPSPKRMFGPLTRVASIKKDTGVELFGLRGKMVASNAGHRGEGGGV
ncbi:MAG: hypothetical protein IJT88_05225, partial [Kiritimatiellae bacterium]|nr:hypothetical protein [Kiritimatiellia bacterium]